MKGKLFMDGKIIIVNNDQHAKIQYLMM